MKVLKNVIGGADTIGELLQFLWERKLWWMIPMMTVFVIFGLLLVFTQGSALAPFIYTLF